MVTDTMLPSKTVWQLSELNETLCKLCFATKLLFPHNLERSVVEQKTDSSYKELRQPRRAAHE